jgi:hypothetical protein
VPHAHANAQIKRALPKKLYAPKSICILSRYSFTLFFRDWLCGVYSLSKELPHSMIDAFIVQLMDKVQTSVPLSSPHLVLHLPLRVSLLSALLKVPMPQPSVGLSLALGEKQLLMSPVDNKFPMTDVLCHLPPLFFVVYLLYMVGVVAIVCATCVAKLALAMVVWLAHFHQIPLHFLFEVLDIDNVLLLFSAVLMEQKLLLVSSQFTLLTYVSGTHTPPFVGRAKCVVRVRVLTFVRVCFQNRSDHSYIRSSGSTCSCRSCPRA